MWLDLKHRNCIPHEAKFSSRWTTQSHAHVSHSSHLFREREVHHTYISKANPIHNWYKSHVYSLEDRLAGLSSWTVPRPYLSRSSIEEPWCPLPCLVPSTCDGYHSMLLFHSGHFSDESCFLKKWITQLWRFFEKLSRCWEEWYLRVRISRWRLSKI